MGNLREFILKKKGNTNGHELATKRSSPPAGAKGNFKGLLFWLLHHFTKNI